MTAKLKDVTASAMALSSKSRALLADLLVESLDADDLGGLGRLWIAEAARRHEDVRSGRVKPIRGDVVLRRARAAAAR